MSDALTPQTITFRDTMLAAVPRWLRNGNMGKVVYTFGLHLDMMSDASTYGVRKRFAEPTSEDAADLLAANRFIIRGREESWDTFRIRLQRWRQDHAIRGGAYALLGQLHAFFSGDFDIALTYYGTDVQRYDMTTSGVITRSTVTFNAPGYGKGHWLLIYSLPIAPPGPIAWGTPGAKWGDGRVWGSGLTPLQVGDYRRVPKQWGNAHTIGRIRLEEAANPSNYIEIGLN